MNGPRYPDEEFLTPEELFIKISRFRGRFRELPKEELEEHQAAFFGYAYSLRPQGVPLRIRPGEGPLKDCDAYFRLEKSVPPELVPVQLKRLPPERINPIVNLESLLAKVSKQCTGGDLIVAVFVDRMTSFNSVTVPGPLHIRELCIWGWSKPDSSEVFVNSYDPKTKQSDQWRKPFPPPGFRLMKS